MNTSASQRCLIVRIGGRGCALRLEDVVETMRPQPVRQVPNAPPFVAGVAVIRGEPTPVIAGAALLGDAHGDARRFVTLRAAGRHVALAVDDVIGVRDLEATHLSSLPPLLSGASAAFVGAIETLDAELTLVLNAGRIVPDPLWTAAEALKGA